MLVASVFSSALISAFHSALGSVDVMGSDVVIDSVVVTGGSSFGPAGLIGSQG